MSKNSEYQVLARKYRPKNFNTLIGQDVMVRTLKNAFESGRLAHAFILTGVRGVGKTTTARILARALNCVGNDGNGKPRIDPCDKCDFCNDILNDRSVDVLEMDAASRTGVDDIRELIEGVRYKPVSARYKIYIIDEVHMLSRSAFNALLKTLEEPPPHIKFIFATTEIRKVPVTVLSRCQRFDLRRVDIETLSLNFEQIAQDEGVNISKSAISLIARAADGSVRDGQSLLDQIIAIGSRASGELGENTVRSVLGLADRERSFDLFETVMKGEIVKALEMLDSEYSNGGDPILLLQDLLEVVHWISRVKVNTKIADSSNVSESDRKRGKMIAKGLTIGNLARAWQLLLKGLNEAKSAPSQIQAIEMVLIRLTHLTDSPSPSEALKKIVDNDSKTVEVEAGVISSNTEIIESQEIKSLGNSKYASSDNISTLIENFPSPNNFEEVIALADEMDERILRANLANNVHLIRFEPGTILLAPGENMPSELCSELTRFLNKITNRRWVVTLSLDEPGLDTFQQRQDKIKASRIKEASKTPFIKSVLQVFPNAKISEVRDIEELNSLSGRSEENSDNNYKKISGRNEK